MDSNSDTLTATTTGTTLQQTDVNVQKTLTPEQEEELKLRAKYPNQKPGGSKFVQKILTKGGHKKYFDSGDYNMAKSKSKLSSIQPSTLTPIANSVNSTPTTPTACDNSSNSSNITSKSSDESSISTCVSACQSPNVLAASSPAVNVNNQHHFNSYSSDQLLTTDNLVSEETIGHEIPKPECLPTRKHSTVQSKLATSEFSS